MVEVFDSSLVGIEVLVVTVVDQIFVDSRVIAALKYQQSL